MGLHSASLPLQERFMARVLLAALLSTVTVAALADDAATLAQSFSHTRAYPPGTVEARLREVISVKDAPFFARCDGSADDTTAIQHALDAAESGAGEVFIPAGSCRTTASLLIDGGVIVRGAGFQKTSIRPDPSVAEAIKIGSLTAHQGVIRDLAVTRDSYSPDSENAGFAFYGSYDSSYYDLKVNNFKYAFLFKPGQGQAVAYVSLFNMQGSRGYRNVYWAPTANGYANEVSFYGGRMFSSNITETQVHWNGGSNCRFVNMSLEGSGAQAILIGGAGNLIEHPRTEGKWTVDDIVVSESALRTHIIAHTFYATVTDRGHGTSFITHNSGSKFSSTLPGVTTLTLSNASQQRATNLELRNSRASSRDYAWKASEAATNSDVGWLSTEGELYASHRVRAGQSGWKFAPLILGENYLWVDATGKLRIKKGPPVSDSDGERVGTQP
jgi:hypothetical protein